MTDNNGWPGKPGVPLNPERDGWHWVKRIGQKQAHTERWIGSHWWLGPSFGGAKTNIEKYEYLGPCLTPAEVEARIKEALLEAADLCDQLSEHTGGICAIAIREMADPAKSEGND